MLEGLDPLVMDLLMKYVYKGLSVSCSLASWLAPRDGNYHPPLRVLRVRSKHAGQTQGACRCLLTSLSYAARTDTGERELAA